MDLASDVLGNGMFDRLMVKREAVIGWCIVRVDLRTRLGVLKDESLQCLRVGPLDHLRTHLVAGSILNPNNRSLANWTSASQVLALLITHVSAFAPHISLINLHGA